MSAVASGDTTFTVESSIGERIVLALENLDDRRGDWGDYVRGILIELRHAGIAIPAANLQISGDVPIGAGLSSSASLEIAVALAMLALARATLEPAALALLAQRAENEHAGTRCGIMDQFAVLHARAGHAMLLDTRTLEVRQVPVPQSAAIVICNTMVKHELSAGAYNDRRRECEESASILGVRELRDATLEMLEEHRSRLPPVLFKRARHVITENARVLDAAQMLAAGDLGGVGKLMYESHESLRDDYEVSCAELDTMAELARSYPGVYGARMTGGGFGGCTVNVVDRGHEAAFRNYIAQAYRKATGILPQLYDGTPAAGAEILHG